MNLPASFIDNIRHLLGNEALEELLSALQKEASVSIRLHPLASSFIKKDHRLTPIPWSTQGYYLDKRLTFTFDPLFHAGCYYVQEASSMFVEQVLKTYVETPVVMLDLCAAPGGKSTHACSVLPEGSLLVANEVNKLRSHILSENLIKWGNPNVVVTNNDPSDFKKLTNVFDVILTDVPCSGEGMFRKDPGAIDEWSPENVEICWQRQRRIISDIWPSLKPGGLLIYSTCTYNTKENEENIAWIEQELGAEVLPVATPEDWAITGSLLEGYDRPVYRFLPHRTRGEGFFLAVLRKSSEEEEDSFKAPISKKKMKKQSSVSSFPKEMMAQAEHWVDNENYCLLSTDSQIVAFPKDYMDVLERLKPMLRIIQTGVTVGELKGKDLLPAHSFAMSRLLRPSCFPSEEIDYDRAIAYLRKEAISLSETAPRGFVLLTYQQIPLGFVKNIGNRANNLYPQEWRIRTTRLPEDLSTL